MGDITFEHATSAAGPDFLKTEAARHSSAHEYLADLGRSQCNDVYFSGLGSIAAFVELEENLADPGAKEANRYSFLLGGLLGLRITRYFLSSDLQARMTEVPLVNSWTGREGTPENIKYVISQALEKSDLGWAKYGQAYDGLLEGWTGELYGDGRLNQRYMQRGLGFMLYQMDMAQFEAELDSPAVLAADWNEAFKRLPES